MYLVQRTFTRPSTDVSWYTPEQTFKDHFAAQYKMTSKVVSETSSVSKDGLTKIINVMWASKADFDAYEADASLQSHAAARHAYNQTAGIRGTRTVSEF